MSSCVSAVACFFGSLRRLPGACAVVALAAALLAGPVAAHGDASGPSLPPPIDLLVNSPLGAAPDGVQDLKFAEIFQSPIGPRGLVPSARLLALHGSTVRLVGYMVRQTVPSAGRLILAALPVTLGDEDEPLADDLPPSAVFVHLAGAAADAQLPHLRGLIRLQGRLSVGPLTEPDGHVSMVRLMLDSAGSGPLALLAAPR